MKKNYLYMGLIIIILAGCLFLINKKMDSIESFERIKENTTDFSLKLLKEVNKDNKSNFLISPYSIEIALSMLKDGTTGETHKEMDRAIPTRTIKSYNVKNHISVANALFIKNKFSYDIKKTFINDVKSKYDSEVLYDDFVTPDIINNWVDEKTDHMIDKILDVMDQDFMIGLANATAIDVEWKDQFECSSTSKELFNTGTAKIEVEGMHQTFSDIEYIDNKDIKGVILPYKTYKETDNEDINLEFIALLPNKDLNSYISNLEDQTLIDVINSKKTLNKNERIRLMLPRFEYTYSINNFIGILSNLGIKKVFTPDAELSNITDIPSYVNEAIHKTYISLNERGTKAAAVTFFGVKTYAAVNDNTYIDIKFDKPFIYLIRDKDSSEILFIGTVYTPNKWEGSTCEKSE